MKEIMLALEITGDRVNNLLGYDNDLITELQELIYKAERKCEDLIAEKEMEE